MSGLLLEAPRVSMLEELDDKREPNKVKNYMEDEVRVTKFGGVDPVTGILLLYDDYFVHVVEGLYEQIFHFINTCTDEADNDYISDIAIVLITHDLPHRMLKKWEWISVRIRRNEELDLGKPLEIVKDFLERIQKLITFMLTHNLEELQEAVDALVESVRESFPSAVVVMSLLKLSLMTATQFVETFRVSGELVLDEEVVWPMVINPYPLDDFMGSLKKPK